MIQFLRPLVEDILSEAAQYPFRRGWTVQGFGMMRCYLGPSEDRKRFRLNIWDSRYKVKGVSTAHDHPWHFKSVIVSGAFSNQRYFMQEMAIASGAWPTHHYTTIKTGEGGGMGKGPVGNCILIEAPFETYKPGDMYSQIANEVHDTKYHDGAVTFNERTRVGDGEHARVFWPYGTTWDDAEPRPAEGFEVVQTMKLALLGYT